MTTMESAALRGYEGLGGTYVLDPDHTRIGFVARHAMVTKVRGQFTDFTGTITVDPANLAASKAEVTIQAASIDTKNAARDGHLRSGDFFSMDEYPELTYRTSHIEQVADTTFRVTGDLTIKGTTRPVTIDFEFTGAATDPEGNFRLGFEGSVVINRHDWGVSWNMGLDAGGVLVSDKVTIEIDVSAIRTE